MKVRKILTNRRAIDDTIHVAFIREKFLQVTGMIIHTEALSDGKMTTDDITIRLLPNVTTHIADVAD